jgi:hypothetical protein
MAAINWIYRESYGTTYVGCINGIKIFSFYWGDPLIKYKLKCFLPGVKTPLPFNDEVRLKETAEKIWQSWIDKMGLKLKEDNND